MYDVLREHMRRLVEEEGLGAEDVRVSARALSPEEAIGSPEEDDYPLIRGRERLMQAQFRDAVGQAFTDMFGSYAGKMSDVLALELTNNYRRAVFIATVNAVMRHLGYIERSIHCKDDGPRKCGRDLASFIETEYGRPRVALVGFQPRMAEALAARFELRVTDLDADNIGTERFGVLIAGPDKTREHLRWCDVGLVTGTTAVNSTIGEFLVDKPVVFYGASIAGVAPILGLKHFCREST